MGNYIFIKHKKQTPDHLKDSNKKVIFHDDELTIIENSDENREPFDYLYLDEEVLLLINGKLYLNEIEDNNSTALFHRMKSLYKKNGEQFVKKLRGKFAFILYDRKQKKIVGARDHFGIKDLLYTEDKGTYFFATAKNPLVSFLEKQLVDPIALQHYVSFQYVPEPLSMTKGIQKLEAGHVFIKEGDGPPRINRYFHARFQPVTKPKVAWKEKIRQTLIESVQTQTEGLDEFGAFLSGGIDSTIIATIAKEIFPEMKTFSVGFQREGFSEIDVAKETAEKLGVENISYVITPEEYIEKLPEIVWHLEDPLADPSCVPLYFVAREAKKYVDVVLSGEGADELFGGYNIYREPESLKIFQSIPKPAKSFLAQIAKRLPDEMKGKSFLLRGTTPLKERYIGNAKMFEEEEKELLLKQYIDGLSYHDVTHPLFEEVSSKDPVEQMQYIDIHTWLRGDILLKAEKMSGANQLDVRMPFLDTKVFDLAKGIPVEYKIANQTTKSILREAVQGMIPDHVLERRKLGFPVPIRHWLKNELYEWTVQLIQESEVDSLIDKKVVLNLLSEHRRGKSDYSRKIWTVLIFMLWHQIFIEKKYTFPK